MTVPGESKGRQSRRSERTMPFLSGEEVVLIGGCHRSMIAKMLDLSEDGTLVYLSDEPDLDKLDSACTLTFYHRGEVFEVQAKVARKSRGLIGFEFVNPPAAVVRRIRAKIGRMADWKRT